MTSNIIITASRVSARKYWHQTMWLADFQFTGQMFEILVKYLSECIELNIINDMQAI